MHVGKLLDTMVNGYQPDSFSALGSSNLSRIGDRFWRRTEQSTLPHRDRTLK